MISCLPTQALAFLVVFVYATVATGECCELPSKFAAESRKPVEFVNKSSVFNIVSLSLLDARGGFKYAALLAGG